MSTATFLQFRKSELSHAVTGQTPDHWLIACGLSHSVRTGTANPRARKCRTCARIIRKSPAKVLPKSEHEGHE